MTIGWKSFLLILLFSYFIILYFWNLGGFSLASWDEAWFGSISKGIIQNGNWLTPIFNGEIFLDHPPLGFWLQAISQFFFAFNEWAVRLPSVIWALGSLFFIYKIGRKWGGYLAGIIATMVLGTCIWFVLRSRSGNLDTILIGNMLGTLYWSIKSKEDNRYLPILFIFFLATILTKSMVGIGIILVSLFWLFPLRKKLAEKLFINFILLIFTLGFWAILVKNISGINPLAKMFIVGTRVGWSNLWSLEFIKNNLFYLHMGVEEWYYPMILALVMSLLFLAKKEFKLLWLWLIIYAGFLLNRKTEIWHLIPVYPALALIMGLTIARMRFLKIFLFLRSDLSDRKNKLVDSDNVGREYRGLLVLGSLFLCVIVIFIRQTSRLIGVIKEQNGSSTEALLSQEAKKYKGNFYLDNDNLPVAAYYSEKRVYSLKYTPPPFNKTDYLLKYGQAGSVVLTPNNNLNNINRSWHQIKRINEKSLVILE